MRTRAPAALEDLRHPSAAHRPMRLRVLARDGDWQEPDLPAAATAARGSAAATGRPAAGPDHPPPGRWRHCCPASNRATSAPSRRCPPHRVGQLRLFRRAPLIDARGRCLRCGGHLTQRRWQRRLQTPAMRAKADSAAANDAMRRQAIRCWQSRSGLNEVSVITTPATRATGRGQSSYSGQAPLEHAPIRPCCGAGGRGRASPFLHCTDPRRSMPLPSSRPG